MKLRGDGISLYREGCVAGQHLFPRHGAGALKQLLKAAGGEICQHQHHPCAAAQVDVQSCAILQRAAAQHTAVFHSDVLKSQTPALIAHQLFQSQQAGNHICIHRITSKMVIF